MKFIATTIYEYLNENTNIPNILYHASNELFDNFELKQGWRTHLLSVEQINTHAIFLTEDIEATKEFGEKYLYKCKIDINMILDWTDYLDERSAIGIKKLFGEIIPWERSDYWMLLDDKRIIEYLKRRGIDGVMFTEIIENHDPFITYAILNPNNIQILEVDKLN